MLLEDEHRSFPSPPPRKVLREACVSRISHRFCSFFGIMKMFDIFSKPPAPCAVPRAVPMHAGPHVKPTGMAGLGDRLPRSPGTGLLSYKSCAHPSLQQLCKHVSPAQGRPSSHQPRGCVVQPRHSVPGLPQPWQQLCSPGCSAAAAGTRCGAVCQVFPSACFSLVVSR